MPDPSSTQLHVGMPEQPLRTGCCAFSDVIQHINLSGPASGLGCSDPGPELRVGNLQTATLNTPIPVLISRLVVNTDGASCAFCN
jgi:hypothetical protein